MGKLETIINLYVMIKVSIQLVFPASGKVCIISSGTLWILPCCFHSISFPSEWESNKDLLGQPGGSVSIQLVFPASGKAGAIGRGRSFSDVSIQLVFPASGKDC